MTTRSTPSVPLPVAVLVVAVVAVVGLLGFLRPGRGSAPAGEPTSRVQAVLPVPVDLLRARLRCPADIGVVVDQQLAVPSGSVVAAHCDAMAGNPPSGVFLLAAGSPEPTVRAVLVPPGANVLVSSMTLAGAVLRVRGQTYSSSDVARCCPDIGYDRSWRLDDDGVATPVDR